MKLELKDFWGGSDNAGWGRLDEKEIEVEANFHGTRKRRLLLFVLSWQRNNGRSLFIVFVLFLFIFLKQKKLYELLMIFYEAARNIGSAQLSAVDVPVETLPM